MKQTHPSLQTSVTPPPPDEEALRTTWAAFFAQTQTPLSEETTKKANHFLHEIAVRLIDKKQTPSFYKTAIDIAKDALNGIDADKFAVTLYHGLHQQIQSNTSLIAIKSADHAPELIDDYFVIAGKIFTQSAKPAATDIAVDAISKSTTLLNDLTEKDSSLTGRALKTMQPLATNLWDSPRVALLKMMQKEIKATPPTTADDLIKLMETILTAPLQAGCWDMEIRSGIEKNVDALIVVNPSLIKNIDKIGDTYRTRYISNNDARYEWLGIALKNSGLRYKGLPLIQTKSQPPATPKKHKNKYAKNGPPLVYV